MIGDTDYNLGRNYARTGRHSYMESLAGTHDTLWPWRQKSFEQGVRDELRDRSAPIVKKEQPTLLLPSLSSVLQKAEEAQKERDSRRMSIINFCNSSLNKKL